MLFSIVIPTYNHFYDLLRPCLDSIERNTNLTDGQKEIIIVSNGSTDETVGYIEFKKRSGLPYKILDFPKPLGFPKAVNIGCLAARGDFLVILNNDVEILACTKDIWLLEMLMPFSDPEVAVSGPVKIVNEATNREFVMFFCVMIRKSVFEQLNGLDESFYPGFGEDVDFCIRATLAGYRLEQVPKGSKLVPKEGEPNVTKVSFPINHKSFQTFGHFVTFHEVSERSNKLLFQKYGRTGDSRENE